MEHIDRVARVLLIWGFDSSSKPHDGPNAIPVRLKHRIRPPQRGVPRSRPVDAFASTAEKDGFEVVIAAAGMSAAPAGTIAANTCLPVIGVPLESGSLQGYEDLRSTEQMPPGVTVESMGIGAAGAKNAAIPAVQIIARKDENSRSPRTGARSTANSSQASCASPG